MSDKVIQEVKELRDLIVSIGKEVTSLVDNEVPSLKTQMGELQKKVFEIESKKIESEKKPSGNSENNNKKILFGGKRTRTKVRDIETGVTYNSKAEVGRKLAGLVNGNPKDNFIWYRILQKFPNRFEEIPEEEKPEQPVEVGKPEQPVEVKG